MYLRYGYSHVDQRFAKRRTRNLDLIKKEEKMKKRKKKQLIIKSSPKSLTDRDPRRCYIDHYFSIRATPDCKISVRLHMYLRASEKIEKNSRQRGGYKGQNEKEKLMPFHLTTLIRSRRVNGHVV